MKRSLPRIFAALLLAGVVFPMCTIWGLRMAFGREREFRAVAKSGQPIVAAIDTFKSDTGQYPTSLAELAPQYLSTPPEISDRENHKYRGWDYELRTNEHGVSFSLRYYLGRGGVEYRAPDWIGNNEGSLKVVLKGAESNNTVQRTGASHSPSDTNRTSSAAGSRR